MFCRLHLTSNTRLKKRRAAAPYYNWSMHACSLRFPSIRHTMHPLVGKLSMRCMQCRAICFLPARTIVVLWWDARCMHAAWALSSCLHCRRLSPTHIAAGSSRQNTNLLSLFHVSQLSCADSFPFGGAALKLPAASVGGSPSLATNSKNLHKKDPKGESRFF
jgi:hypothetical protein